MVDRTISVIDCRQMGWRGVCDWDAGSVGTGPCQVGNCRRAAQEDRMNTADRSVEKLLRENRDLRAALDEVTAERDRLRRTLTAVNASAVEALTHFCIFNAGPRCECPYPTCKLTEADDG